MTPEAVLALQAQAGNAAVGRLFAANQAPAPPLQRHMGHGTGGASDSALPATAVQRMTPGEVQSQISELDEQLSYYGPQQGLASSDFYLRFARDWTGEEAEQTLAETSTLLFESMRSVHDQLDESEKVAARGNDREVQGMLINDRLVFASNLNSSGDALMAYGASTFGEEPTLYGLLSLHDGGEPRPQGQSNAARENWQEMLASFRRKNQAIVSQQRGAGEQGRGRDATALALSAKLGEPVIPVNVEDPLLHEYLRADSHRGRVFFLRVKALDPRPITSGIHKGKMSLERQMHAEQKLLLALHIAGISPGDVATKPLAIMGKFRPCMGCAAALMYYRDQLGYTNLRFDENYGHYYSGSVDSLAAHQAHIMDENYLGYMRQMIEEGLTSTPAKLDEAAPEEAQYWRGGPTLRIEAQYASKAGFVTPSNSDAETDETGAYRRVRRQQKKWTATKELGPPRARPGVAAEELTADEQKELRDLWKGVDGKQPTRKDWEKAVELGHRYATERDVPIKYMAEIVGLKTTRWRQLLRDYEEKGHTKYVPSRSRHVASQSEPRSRKTGDPERQFTQGGKIDKNGERDLKAVIRSIPTASGSSRQDVDWCLRWERKSQGHSGELAVSQMPLALIKEAAKLRHKHGFGMPSMARYLQLGEERAKHEAFRKAVQKEVDKLTEPSPGQAAIKSEEVEMPEAPDYTTAFAPESSYGGAGYGSTATTSYSASYSNPFVSGYTTGGQTMTSPFDQTTMAAPEVEPVPGFTLQHDPSTGQQYYVHQQTGEPYFLINGQMYPAYH
ncbi:hypothetical protein OHR68_32495 [Spirillospora sp. NBC_00431]